jgi:hypothetical protein
MNNKVRMVLQDILEKFKTGDVPKAIAYAMFPVTGIPSDKWSLMNKMIMLMSGTTDARGIRQWNRVGRTVKRGAKAIYILVPYFVKKKRRIEEDENEILKGFFAKPVFRVEDTEGETLEYEKVIPLPELPLLEKAKEWGITVSTIVSHKKFLGVYLADIKEIVIASSDEIVFFHELSHAAYELCIGRLQPGQRWDQEIIAELSAQALCHLIGKQPKNNLGNTYRYIEAYAAEAGMKPITACMQVIHDVETILNFILGKGGGKHVERSIERAA